MKHPFLLYFFLFLAYPVFTQAQSYPEVWFEDSNLPVRYSNSHVSYWGNSWIKNIKGQLPVSKSVFYTPNNALEIRYTSARNGHWGADVFYPRSINLSLRKEFTLHFKLFIESNTAADELPALELIQAKQPVFIGDTLSEISASYSIPLKKIIKKVERNKWLFVELPLKDVDLDLEHGIETIRFLQNSSDGKEHVLFVDQIEFLPSSFPQSQLTSAAVLSSATAYERHVDLTWKLPLTPSIRYIKFYRSSDNKTFLPVAIRPVFAKKYSDVVPQRGETYYYKISWVDYYYRESPLSTVLEVKMKELNDDALVSMVQNANIDYFVDGEEFNSGMQLRHLYNQNSEISVEKTGVGILALITGIKDDFQARDMLLKRLEKVLSFLENAERAHGVFPEFMDGRTGKAVYRDRSDRQDGTLIVDLESTGILMQALLVSKQYFNQNNDSETDLRNRITKIWRAVEWNAFVNPENLYLFNKWSSQNGIREGTPLSGLSSLYLYIMGLASPENNINLESYYKALTKPLKVDERNISHQDSVLIEEDLEELTTIIRDKENAYSETSFVNGRTYYGIPLFVDDIDQNLSQLLLGFIALDLRGKRDEFADYYENTRNLIKIQHRQSLEEGKGFANTKWEASKEVAIYPYVEQLALENLKYYYLNHAETLWTEYGFVRAIDFKQNQIIYPKVGVENGLNAVMIDNAKTGLIWKLYQQDSDINSIVKALFKK